MNYISKIREFIGTAPIFLPAAGIIVYQNGKILLQKRRDTEQWALHGGAMELGETTEETAVREANEEIRITPESLELYGVFSGKPMYHVYPDGNEYYIVSTVYFCDKYTGELKHDNNEVMEIKWFDINNLPENIAPIDCHILENLHSFLRRKYAE